MQRYSQQYYLQRNNLFEFISIQTAIRGGGGSGARCGLSALHTSKLVCLCCPMFAMRTTGEFNRRGWQYELAIVVSLQPQEQRTIDGTDFSLLVELQLPEVEEPFFFAQQHILLVCRAVEQRQSVTALFSFLAQQERLGLLPDITFGKEVESIENTLERLRESKRKVSNKNSTTTNRKPIRAGGNNLIKCVTDLLMLDRTQRWDVGGSIHPTSQVKADQAFKLLKFANTNERTTTYVLKYDMVLSNKKTFRQPC